ncbi:S-adenosyl-L-methionine-dependent methyltransferase [Mycena metata]|uniref:Protein arginine methyltransferase NDUFAF7 n=1 Tax=Mycena metata TaxID=1033252 RepID=A0AAD7GPW3_9AGAR|nr:S-adenosyl-L-methionine-dependent methyltransferase [Mycena metata]
MLRCCARRKILDWRASGTNLSRRLSSVVPPVTPVEKIIVDGIKATGPISLATYMQLCLSHPTFGYYMSSKNPIFGPQGDFVTSPEISGVFGELLGVWLAAQWMSTSPRLPIRVVELGPGRGTLMADVLRVVAQFVGKQLKTVHLVETSTTLRALQDTRLAPSAEKYGCTVEWHDSVEQIVKTEAEYTMVLAHEFFDALPVHSIQRTDQGWQEVLIALAESDPTESESKPHPRLRYVLSPHPTAASTLLGLSSPRFRHTPVGGRVEVSPVGFKTMRKVGELLCHTPDIKASLGCGLIVDYGGPRAFAESFRAFKNHAIVDPFTTPGECDLTANVDFSYLQEAVADLGLRTHGPLPQAAFLERMGLGVRVESLVSRVSSSPGSEGQGDRTAALRSAAQRLVDPAGMGSEYAVLGLGGEPTPEGVVWPFVEGDGQAVEEDGEIDKRAGGI